MSSEPTPSPWGARVPDLEEVDPSDRCGVLEAREQAFRDRAVYQMRLMVLRDEMQTCYMHHPMDHKKHCREIAEDYMESFRNPPPTYHAIAKRRGLPNGAGPVKGDE